MYPNVKYELRELEDLISSGREGRQDIEQPGILSDIVGQEVERIKKTFIHEVFTFTDERHLERYIQYHQQALIRLMDQLARDHNVDHGATERSSYTSYYKGIEELLSFVERHFAKYFDQDAKAPESYIAMARKDATRNYRKIQKGLTNKNADTRIGELMLYVLRKISDESSLQGTTYRKVIYAKEIQKELFRLLDNSIERNIDEELRLLMYYLNYNSIRCFTYFANYINSVLNEVETRIEKIEKLSYLLKTINQAQVKPGIGYNVLAPSLVSQLNGYIVEEIEHYERLQQLANVPNSSLDKLLGSFKIQFDLSVAQIAFLVKIFIETQVIVTNNVTGILRFLSKFLVSKRTESLSYDSFRAKFYNVESGTRESVKGILLKMVEHIDRK
jgi:hypothetical protein